MLLCGETPWHAWQLRPRMAVAKRKPQRAPAGSATQARPPRSDTSPP